MSKENLELTEVFQPEWLDPFPEPQTLPRGWNLDSLTPVPAPSSAQATDDPSENQTH